MNKIKLIKFFDKIIGRFICSLLIVVFRLNKEASTTAPDLPKNPSKILIIRPGGIGDAVLLFPLLTALKERYPLCDIYILAEKRNAQVFCANHLAKHIYLRDSLFGMDLFKALTIKFDMVIDTEQYHYSSAIFTFFTRAKVRCGFNTNQRGHLFTHKVEYSHQCYEVKSFLSLYHCLVGEKITFDYESVFFPLDEMHLERAQQNLSSLKGTKTVCLLMGASVPEKRWSSSKYDEIIQWLLSLKVNVVLCDGNEHSSGDYLLNLKGQASLPEIAGIIACCDVFLSSDTGILHLAYGLGIPTVAMFGPGIIEKWAPRGEKHIVVTKDVPCAPCTKFGTIPPCLHNLICMRNISVEDVQNEISHLL